MELPNLGQNCHESTCSQLDFLPMKCDSCSNVFCKDHITYEQHKCAAGFRKDVQVPVCPLCNKPVPGKRGEAPDIGVSDHIDRECQSDPAVKKRKVYSNRCTKKGCKQKELVPVLCSSCHQNFCLKHRHTVDHDCQGYQASGKGGSRQGGAAIARHQGSNKSAGSSSSSSSSRNQARPQQTSMAALGRDLDRERRDRLGGGRQQAAGITMQAGMSEDEAMSRAIQMSLTVDSRSSNKPTRPPANPRQLQQEDEDLALARALAAIQMSLTVDSRSSNKPTRPPANPRELQQEDEDLALARALAASEEEERNRRRRQQQQQSESDSKCALS